MAQLDRRLSHSILLAGFLTVATGLASCGVAERPVGSGPPPAGSSSAALRDKRSPYQVVVDEFFPQMNAPGLAVAVTKGTEIVYAGAVGLADIETGTAATIRTPFLQASVTKMVTATALMQLWEKGKFRLDDDVNAYLPFRVRNPAAPDVPITFRMLLSHGSSIGDNYDMMPYYSGGDPVPSLGGSLRAYFDPSTPGFDPGINFSSWAPGTLFSYSNIGFALIGYLVERISGQPFHAYCREHIFQPLGMNAGFFMRDFKRHSVQPAMPYSRDGATGQFVPYGQYEIWDYPDGTLRADVVSMARFLTAHLNGGKVPGYPRILQASTVELMHRPAYARPPNGTCPGDPALPTWDCWVEDVPGFWTNSIGWPVYGMGVFTVDYGFDALVGHEGNDLGVFSWVYGGRNDGIGVAMMANGETWALPEYWNLFMGLAGRLTEVAARASVH
jgi:CubicO group peptidase (beta-lactamase class C family)